LVLNFLSQFMGSLHLFHSALFLAAVLRPAAAQTTEATFGDVIRLGGTPSDLP